MNIFWSMPLLPPLQAPPEPTPLGFPPNFMDSKRPTESICLVLRVYECHRADHCSASILLGAASEEEWLPLSQHPPHPSHFSVSLPGVPHKGFQLFPATGDFHWLDLGWGVLVSDYSESVWNSFVIIRNHSFTNALHCPLAVMCGLRGRAVTNIPLFLCTWASCESVLITVWMHLLSVSEEDQELPWSMGQKRSILGGNLILCPVSRIVEVTFP